MALSAANAIAQLSKVRAFGDKLVASARSGFADTASVTTMEQAAQKGDSVAQAAVEEKKAEAKASIIRTGLLDIIMGSIAAFVAFKYNSRMDEVTWLKVLTCVAAFFFWPLYLLYTSIRCAGFGMDWAQEFSKKGFEETLKGTRKGFTGLSSELQETLKGATEWRPAGYESYQKV